MPIVDYEKNAVRDEAWFFSLNSVSEINKNVIRRFLKIYNVKPSTKSKFFKNIKFLLEKIDLEKDLLNRDKINNVFAELQKECSPGYISTIINVSKRLARWLNDGELPKGFKDLKKANRKDQRRKLNPEDMWSWEDGKKLASLMNSTQMKAMIFTQLDAGFRPSEFVDLKYKDVIVKKDIIIFQVQDGKTGSRPVPCQRCVPYFLRWYEQHPTKNPDDPLWITEFREKSNPAIEGRKDYKIRPYRYHAILKRIKWYAQKANIKKPCDFYDLRHSSCVLDKLDNVPLDVAAARHGHSVEYFTEIYGRLDLDDLANRMRLHYGGKIEKRKIETTKVCERCDFPNVENAGRCDKCGSALSLKVALEMEKQKDDDYNNLKDQMNEIQQSLAKLAFRENKRN